MSDNKKPLGKIAGVRLPEDVSLKIAVIANREYESSSEIIRRACEELISRYEQENGVIPNIELEKAKAALDKKK